VRAALLHLDAALTHQDMLAAQVIGAGGCDLDARDLGPELRLWSRPQSLERLAARLRQDLPASAGPALVFSGSGEFHHVSPILLRRAIEAAGCEAVTVLHFDSHPDWVRFAKGVHCGSWLGQAARMPGVAKVITAGVCGPDIRRPSPRRADLGLLTEERLELYAYRGPDGAASVELCGQSWPTIAAMGERVFAAFLADRVATEAIYITIDKDVLRPRAAASNGDQGQTSLEFLKALIAPLLASHRLIGADVVGDWSPGIYGGGTIATLLKRSEALLDPSWAKPAPAARAANEDVNLQLFKLIAGGAP
jgi:arginase family enzyme